MNKATLIVAVSIFASGARAGEVAGTALDLAGKAIPNVTVQVLDGDGRRIQAGRFSDGNYNLAIQNNVVPNSSQGVTVIFSSPGRETVQVNLHARSDNAFNIVMPERKEAAAQIVECDPCVPCHCQMQCCRTWCGRSCRLRCH